MKKIPDPKKMKKIKGPQLSRAELDSSKIRITTYLNKDVLDTLREMALASGSKYQTILNQILSDYLFGKKEGLVARIAKLEETVFKKRAA